MSFYKILVAIDNSQLCKPVFAKALELAQVNKGRLMLLNCLTSDMVGEPLPMSVDMGLYPEMMNTAYQTHNVVIEQRLKEAQAMLEGYCETAVRWGVPTEFDYKVGDAGQLICKVAAEWGAELIVLGRRGRKGLAEVLLGSVSNYVLHHAHCSILVIQETETKAS